MINVVSKIRNKILYYKNEWIIRERSTSFGNENKNIVFYVIGIPYPMAGLFAIIKSNLSHICYSIEKGLIPVIDMGSHTNQYLLTSSSQINNPWEYFFEQPMNYSLKDIAKSKNIVLSKKAQSPNRKYSLGMSLLDDREGLSKYNNLFKKYIIPNKRLKTILSKREQDYFNNDERVLGILCRGTDYTQKQPAGHPVQPTPELVIQMAWKVLKEHNCTKIFLATEDNEILRIFQKEFKEILMYAKQKRFGKNDLEKAQFLSQIKQSPNELYEQSIEYYSSIYILSKCHCFIGGRTAGTLGVYLMTDGFEFDYNWNLGVY